MASKRTKSAAADIQCRLDKMELERKLHYCIMEAEIARVRSLHKSWLNLKSQEESSGFEFLEPFIAYCNDVRNSKLIPEELKTYLLVQLQLTFMTKAS